jgi:two-component system, NtrC family, sensor kinase
MAAKNEQSTQGHIRRRAKPGGSREVLSDASKSEMALQERVKELTCLYEIVKLRVRKGASFDELLQGVVELLPPAWLHSEIACARVTVDDRRFESPSAVETVQQQSANIVVAGTVRGTVEVGYQQRRPELDEGPFLTEERQLLDAVAREIGLILERRGAEEEGAKLQDQLRHADRLATIGELSAGIAHELNEPLGNILGFAQLTAKTAGLPAQASRDIEKIVRATLRAREILRSLMLFARQTQPKKVNVDLNRLVQEGLEFLEARCSRGGVKLSRDLAPDLPEVTADPSQLLQVIVNLVVNALQAMPDGGTLVLRTLLRDDKVLLMVKDDGAGMSEEVRQQIFVPFFTTKDVGEGTGLGLSVVHGIVTSHGGSIRVESRPGGGTTFEVSLPIQAPGEIPRHE